MSAKLEWTLLAALTVTAGVLYATKSDGDKTADESAPSATTIMPAIAGEAVAPTVGDEDEKDWGIPTPDPNVPVRTARSLSNGLPAHGHWRGHLAIADIDADGHLDIFSALRRWDPSTPGEGLYVWRGDGAGNWRAANDGLRRDMGYGGSAVADFDGDQNVDVAFSGHDVTPHVFLGDGAGAWRPIVEQPFIEVMCSDVAAGDVTGDGFADLLVSGFWPKSGGVLLFAGNGAGGFAPAERLLDTDHFGQTIEIADLFSDGEPEIIATTAKGVKVLERDENGEWIDRSAGLPADPEVGGSDIAAIAVDLDGDDHLELAVAGMVYGGHLPLQFFRWGEDSWFPCGRGIPSDEAYFDVTQAQLDGDEPLEFVLAGREGLTVIDRVGPDQFVRVCRIADTSSVINVNAADVSGDERDEVVIAGFFGVKVLGIDLGGDA